MIFRLPGRVHEDFGVVADPAPRAEARDREPEQEEAGIRLIPNWCRTGRVRWQGGLGVVMFAAGEGRRDIVLLVLCSG